MIDIYAKGIDLLEVDLSINTMDAIMESDIVSAECFIQFRFSCVKSGRVKKGAVVAYTECFEEAY